jgi:hypothetical protein
LKGISVANPQHAAIWFEPKDVKSVHYLRSWHVIKAGSAVKVTCQNMKGKPRGRGFKKADVLPEKPQDRIDRILSEVPKPN